MKRKPNGLGMVLGLIWVILVLLFLVSKEHGSGFRRRELEGHRTEDVKHRGITEVNESSHFSANELLITSHLHIH